MNITIKVHPDETAIRGNAMASGDDAYDKQVEDKIIADLENGNIWAWCVVEVIVEMDGMVANDFLGACSYENEEAFVKASGYYDDMVAACVEQIEERKNIRKYRVSITDITLLLRVEALTQEAAEQKARQHWNVLPSDIIFGDGTKITAKEQKS